MHPLVNSIVSGNCEDTIEKCFGSSKASLIFVCKLNSRPNPIGPSHQYVGSNSAWSRVHCLSTSEKSRAFPNVSPDHWTSAKEGNTAWEAAGNGWVRSSKAKKSGRGCIVGVDTAVTTPAGPSPCPLFLWRSSCYMSGEHIAEQKRTGI